MSLYRRAGLAYVVESLFVIALLPTVQAAASAKAGDYKPLRRLSAVGILLLAFSRGGHPERLLSWAGRTCHLQSLWLLAQHGQAAAFTFWMGVFTTVYCLLADPDCSRLQSGLSRVCRWPETLFERLPKIHAVLVRMPDLLMAVRRPAQTRSVRLAFALTSLATLLVYAAWLEQILEPGNAVLSPSRYAPLLLGEFAASIYSGARINLLEHSFPTALNLLIAIPAWIVIALVPVRAIFVSGGFWEILSPAAALPQPAAAVQKDQDPFARPSGPNPELEIRIVQTD
ncbi:MAG: hypothetical protein HYT87_19825 [Nitrospirae bacterium]|nr:hypothetical protein [Nitrospirota bacterium]